MAGLLQIPVEPFIFFDILFASRGNTIPALEERVDPLETPILVQKFVRHPSDDARMKHLCLSHEVAVDSLHSERLLIVGRKLDDHLIEGRVEEPCEGSQSARWVYRRADQVSRADGAAVWFRQGDEVWPVEQTEDVSAAVRLEGHLEFGLEAGECR